MMYEEQVLSLTARIALGRGTEESSIHTHANQYNRASHCGHALRQPVTKGCPLCKTTPSAPRTKGVHHDAQDEEGDAQATQADLHQCTDGS